MQYSIYEIIINNSQFPMNALIISLDSVTWHWHNEYELIGVLSGSMKAKVQSNEYTLNAGDVLRVTVTVRNIGGMEADTSVLLFVGAPGIVVEREERLLKGFARIHLKENEEQSVTMECPLEELTYFDEESGEMVLEQGTYRIFVEDLQAEILIK